MDIYPQASAVWIVLLRFNPGIRIAPENQLNTELKSSSVREGKGTVCIIDPWAEVNPGLTVSVCKGAKIPGG